MADPQAWRARAACRGMDTAIFFPDIQGPGAPTNAAVAAARAVCDRCPVRDECLRFALVNRERDGVWGGTSPSERRLRRTQRYPRRCQVCRGLIPPELNSAAIYCSSACRSTATTRRDRGRRRAG